jgi:hypothetical protein
VPITASRLLNTSVDRAGKATFTGVASRLARKEPVGDQRSLTGVAASRAVASAVAS